MAISKTKLNIDDSIGYFFYYEDYDDNGVLTDYGYKFYESFQDDLIVSDDDGVYIDSIGTYTKDDDGNKVYHNMEINLNKGFVYVDSSYDKLDELDDLAIKVDLNSEVKNLSLISDFANGVYEDDNDNYYLKIDIVGSKTLIFKSKNSDYKLVSFEIPYTKNLLRVLNKDFSFNNILEFSTMEDMIQTMQYAKLKEDTNNILSKEDTIESKIDSVSSDLSTLSSNVDSYKDTLENDITTAKDDISSTITLSKDEINSKIDDKVSEIETKIDESKVEIVSLNGSAGAKYKDGSIVEIEDYIGQWKILKSFIYKNKLKVLSVSYKVKGISDENQNDIMFIDETLISKFIDLDTNTTTIDSTTEDTSDDSDSSTEDSSSSEDSSSE